MLGLSSPRGRALIRHAVAVLAAGAVLLAVAQVRLGAGAPGGIALVGAGAAAVSDPGAAPLMTGSSSRFSISGNVAGLYPGASLLLVLTISNPQQFAIVVNSITTSVGSPSASCSAANLSVSSFLGSLAVPAQGTATVTVTATMPHSAPNACQGAVFPLQYSGTAVKP